MERYLDEPSAEERYDVISDAGWWALTKRFRRKAMPWRGDMSYREFHEQRRRRTTG